MINRLLSELGQSVFNSYRVTDSQLSAFRMVYCLLLILVIGLPALGWIPLQAELMFSPVPPLSWIMEKSPGTVFFQLLSGGILLSLLVLLFGCRTRIASIALSLLLLIAYAFYYAFGKIDHNILLVLTPLLMAWSGWGNRYSLDAVYFTKKQNIRRNTDALFNLALLIGFAFFTAGIAKVFGGWLELDHLATRGQFYQNYYGRERMAYAAELLLKLEAEWIWKMLDLGVVVFEVFFLLAVVNRRIFQAFLTMACLFHISVVLFFNIAFLANVAVYFAFVKWPKSLSLEQKGRSINRRYIAALVMVLLLGLLGWDIYFYVPDWSMLGGNTIAPLQVLLSWWTSKSQLYLVLILNCVLVGLFIYPVLFHTTD